MKFLLSAIIMAFTVAWIVPAPLLLMEGPEISTLYNNEFPFSITEPTTLPNGCLVAAFEFECAVTARNELQRVTWAKLVLVHYFRVGHAFCVYRLRNGDIYSYDTLHGSMKLETHSCDIKSIVASLKANDHWILNGHFAD